MKRFPEKRVVITGAGSGFGRALSLSFARRNWRVGVVDINEERADETVALVNDSGGKGEKSLCDVTRPEQIREMAAHFQNRWSGIDIAVNNAGVAAGGYMDEITLEIWRWIVELDLMSVIYGCRTFIPLMAGQPGGGHIVNMASCAGIACLPEMSCYNVPKAGVIALSETLRLELAPKNIGVTVVAPTFFKTNLMDQFQSPRQRQEEMANTFFDKSLATADKVAEHAYRCVDKKKLYAICQIDGKTMWRLKRLAPELYHRLGGFFYKKELYKKYFNFS